MKYKNTLNAIFIKRENRFIAEVLINNKKETVYVPNTGRCKEILIEGVKVVLSKSDNPNRKTKYSLISVYKDDRLINIDSQAPNEIVFEAIKNKKIFNDIEFETLIREKNYDKSRFDIYYEGLRNSEKIKGFIEVKGVTLEDENIVYFPDAPTLRGLKHIKELIKCKEEGYEANIVFLVQMENVKYFLPNAKMQIDFAKEILKAKQNGVNILSFDCKVDEDELILKNKVEIGNIEDLIKKGDVAE